MLRPCAECYGDKLHVSQVLLVKKLLGPVQVRMLVRPSSASPHSTTLNTLLTLKFPMSLIQMSTLVSHCNEIQSEKKAKCDYSSVLLA